MLGDYTSFWWVPAAFALLAFAYFMLPETGWPIINEKFLTRPPRWFAVAVLFIFVSFFIALLSRLASDVLLAGSADNINKLLLGLAGLLSAPFLVWRTWIADRQRHIAKEDFYTGLLVKAIEQLGATREEKRSGEVADGEGKTKIEMITSTVPNTEVRLGAIYALEKLARDYEPLHWSIMEVLCAYVRRNAGIPKQTPEEIIEICSMPSEQWTGDQLAMYRLYFKELKPFVDVQAALTVIGRRSPAQRAYEQRRRAETKSRNAYRLDLSSCQLACVQLEGLHFEHSNFDWSCFEGASLGWGHFEGASFNNSRFHHTYIPGAQFIGASFSYTELNCLLDGARFDGATFLNANFYRLGFHRPSFIGTSLMGAWLSGADLNGACIAFAHLEGAYLEGAHLDEASLDNSLLDDAVLDGCDLRRVRGLTSASLSAARGSAKTKLPEGLPCPQNERWEKEDATYEQHVSRHETWKSRRAFWIEEGKRRALEEERKRELSRA